MMPVTKRITDYNKNRDPFFLKIKYKALTESSFRFFRGTCHLFYEDLHKNMPFEDTTKTWICGDLHLENFGTYKGNNGLVYFDLNDFDEAILAPATWEVMRALTSIYLAVASLKKEVALADELANCFINTYITNIIAGKPLVFERNTTKGLIKTFITVVSKRKSQELLEGRLLFNGTDAVLKIIKGKTVAIEKIVKASILLSVKNWCKTSKHINWKACDAAYRIAGTGSLGVKRFVILMYDKKVDRYFLLDIKEALPSSLERYNLIKQPVWDNEAERVTTIQNYNQNVVPSLLGTINYNDTQYVIKRLQPTADRMSLAMCNGKLKKLEEIIDLFAEISASAQLRSTGRKGSSTTDEMIDFFQTNTLQLKKSLVSYSKKYAHVVARYYADYCKNYQP